MAERSLSRDEVRRIDERALREYGVPGMVLMENAARGAVEWLVSLGIAGRVVICTGRGNNGGDGFAMARHLDCRRVDVRVLHFGDPGRLAGDAAANCAIVQAAGIPCRAFDSIPDAHELDAELAAADWIVDALLGTGTRGEIREPFVTAIGRINAAGRKVLAVDLPSGLDCDTGAPLGPCVRADHTVTFVARKKGFDLAESTRWTGAVHVADIGAPRKLLEEVFGQSPGG